MITALMEAMIAQAPQKARTLQNRGPDAMEKAVREAANRAHETLDPGGKISAQGPNEAQMVNEQAFQDALAELTA